MEELIQWNEKPALPDKPYGFTAEVWNVTVYDELHGYHGWATYESLSIQWPV